MHAPNTSLLCECKYISPVCVQIHLSYACANTCLLSVCKYMSVKCVIFWIILLHAARRAWQRAVVFYMISKAPAPAQRSSVTHGAPSS